jgi:hypothetical protein
MDYKNGKIYTLRSHLTDKIYIGSTTTPLHKRFYNHKKSYDCWSRGNSAYLTSVEILKYPDVYIELLEEFPCDNKLQLNTREGEYIRTMDCVNKNIPGRTPKEWYDANRDLILRKKKECYDKEHKKAYYNNHKERYKEYYKKNREKRLTYQKERYRKNKISHNNNE